MVPGTIYRSRNIVTKEHRGAIAVASEIDGFTEFVVTPPRQMFVDEGTAA